MKKKLRLHLGDGRNNWLKLGTLNTIQHRNTNAIRRNKGLDGKWVDEEDKVSELFHHVLTPRINESFAIVDKLILKEVNVVLMDIASNEEIENVSKIGSLKALGPNGLSGTFCLNFWYVIKEGADGFQFFFPAPDSY
ncbi:hypothetical protein PVK06_032087 [Gossypium arboreum]|uniref:Uncharacterized protein n=1 Tax=Gossypium arboreum TaxID=29729 RepID=A0ABR0NSX8_GOSAR|nr:hypothetical protein PVK06_032087 [Gossypium arboreum]